MNTTASHLQAFWRKMELTDILDRVGEVKYDGSSVNKGVPYQNVPPLGLNGMRDKSDWRAERICELVDIKRKRVLDLGCSVGTMASIFKKKGASFVLGIDHDKESIRLAESVYGNDVKFQARDISLEFVETMDFFDVVVWTSQFMWMVKQHGMSYALDFLYRISKKCTVLVFETAGQKDGSAPLDMAQEDLINLLIANTCFQKIVDHGPWSDGWAPRNVFVCENPVVRWESDYSFVERYDRRSVKKTYRSDLSKPEFVARARELKFREESFLQKFCTSTYFPMLCSSTDDSIYMEYVGGPAAWVPESDCLAILDALRSRKVIHRDIRPENLLWNGKNCVLIDFTYAVNQGDVTNYHYDLGGQYKCPYGFNDEYSLRKIQHDLMKGVV